MPTVVTRASKGSALTWAEGDANINNLNTAIDDIVSGTQVVGNATNADNIDIATTDGNTSDTAMSVVLVPNQATGNQAPHIDAGLTYNASTNALTATTFVGALSGNATSATNINITSTDGNTNDTTMNVVLVGAQSTGNQALHVDGGLLYNASTNALTATTFSGALSGTATNATNINISTASGNTSDTTLYPVFVAAGTTGNQLPHIDATGLAFNATDNILTIGSTIVATAVGSIELADGQGNGETIIIRPPSTVTAGYTLTLPADDGTSNQVLTTNGTGTLSWTTPFTSTSAFSGSINTTSLAILNSTVASNPKLTIGTGALSSGAWTTAGIGLRVSAATYTDTTSVAGTVATSVVHGIAASTLASTNAITVTDAATLYVAAAPTAGTNTTITNGWAILSAGRIKASAIDATPVGSTTASTGAFTTLSVSGQLTLSSTLNAGGGNGTNGQVLQSTGTGVQWATISGGGGITDLVQDTTPQLGGNLDVNGQQIVSVSNGNIVIAPNGTGITQVNNIEYYEKIHSLGTTSGTVAPDVANGNVQTITLNGNLTLNAFTNPIAGQSVTLIVNTGGTSRTLTSTMKFAGGEKTLSTTNTTDIISVFYDGTNYWASLGKDFK